MYIFSKFVKRHKLRICALYKCHYYNDDDDDDDDDDILFMLLSSSTPKSIGFLVHLGLTIVVSLSRAYNRLDVVLLIYIYILPGLRVI